MFIEYMYDNLLTIGSISFVIGFGTLLTLMIRKRDNIEVYGLIQFAMILSFIITCFLLALSVPILLASLPVHIISLHHWVLYRSYWKKPTYKLTVPIGIKLKVKKYLDKEKGENGDKN